VCDAPSIYKNYYASYTYGIITFLPLLSQSFPLMPVFLLDKFVLSVCGLRPLSGVQVEKKYNLKVNLPLLHFLLNSATF